MRRILIAAFLLLPAVPTRAGEAPTLDFPASYREWVYLSTGFDMTYNPAFAAPNHHMFSNVFVNPEAYRAFLATGHWPDKTMLVLEIRGASAMTSLNKAGSFQDVAVMGIEVHARDDERFPGGWGFFAFGGRAPADRMPDAADCYACHQAHGAVDTSFAQFYPTLLPTAQAKGTLSDAYRRDMAK